MLILASRAAGVTANSGCFWKAEIQELDDEELALDIHHIFPQDWCEKGGIKRAVYNTIVNKTPISCKANRMIGGNAPSSYLLKLQTHAQVQLGDAQMNAILSTHYVDPTSLRNDDFRAFYAARKAALVKIVERAMGKSAAAANLGVDDSEQSDEEGDASQ